VADIGGTHARLARWSASAGLGAPARFRNDDFAGPLELLDGWLRESPGKPRQVVLALAMPVGGDASQLTNRDWRFEPRALIDALRLDALVIVNDFAAAAAGVDALGPDAIESLNPSATAAAGGARLVLGPGTGLGTAAILPDEPPRILASEAGHMTLGSAEPIAARLHADGCRRWGRVSWERALSGDGLAWLEATLAARAELARPEDVAQRAASGDPHALAAVGLFSRLLGEFAGDACLAFQALAGVYLCGGVLRGVMATFDAAGFMATFAAKGRFSAQLQKVPVVVAAGGELGLHGAARYLAGACRMPAQEWRP
jgi:glucokinase